jgi:hypothetical protein
MRPATAGESDHQAPLDRAFAEVEAQIAAVEAWPDDDRKAAARELAAALLELHRLGLARLLRAVGDRAESASEDPGVGALLVLHGLHPHERGARARAAVARLQGAFPDLEMVRLVDGAVVVRVGARGGGATTPSVVQAALLEAVPDLTSVEVEIAPAAGLTQLRRRSVEP